MKESWDEFTFGDRTFTPVVRTLGELQEVLYDQGFLVTASMEMVPLYYMFREVAKNDADAQQIAALGLRYDITIIPPMKLGLEFVKTAGHYHPCVPGSKLTYPEIYEVLEGEAHYLLQKREMAESGGEAITDVMVIQARRGDKVIIPPNYGHVTINPSKTTLKMANWVARSFSSIYEPYKERGGAAYFELTSRKFVRNDRYEAVPAIRFLRPAATWLEEVGLSTVIPMYELLREPAKLEFLLKPEVWFR
ncbi:MAG TPA: glucose-6-phosphate isomerase [Methanomicrobia archaeon]|nr:glucose-6-phosphate isomerase [Methanomicrobia archaeon]